MEAARNKACRGGWPVLTPPRARALRAPLGRRVSCAAAGASALDLSASSPDCGGGELGSGGSRLGSGGSWLGSGGSWLGSGGSWLGSGGSWLGSGGVHVGLRSSDADPLAHVPPSTLEAHGQQTSSPTASVRREQPDRDERHSDGSRAPPLTASSPPSPVAPPPSARSPSPRPRDPSGSSPRTSAGTPPTSRAPPRRGTRGRC